MPQVGTMGGSAVSLIQRFKKSCIGLNNILKLVTVFLKDDIFFFLKTETLKHLKKNLWVAKNGSKSTPKEQHHSRVAAWR